MLGSGEKRVGIFSLSLLLFSSSISHFKTLRCSSFLPGSEPVIAARFAWRKFFNYRGKVSISLDHRLFGQTNISVSKHCRDTGQNYRSVRLTHGTDLSAAQRLYEVPNSFSSQLNAHELTKMRKREEGGKSPQPASQPLEYLSAYWPDHFHLSETEEGMDDVVNLHIAYDQLLLHSASPLTPVFLTRTQTESRIALSPNRRWNLGENGNQGTCLSWRNVSLDLKTHAMARMCIKFVFMLGSTNSKTISRNSFH